MAEADNEALLNEVMTALILRIKAEVK
jgi:hypothetical protein